MIKPDCNTLKEPKSKNKKLTTSFPVFLLIRLIGQKLISLISFYRDMWHFSRVLYFHNIWWNPRGQKRNHSVHNVSCRELPGALHRRARLWLQGLHLPQGDPSVHVPGRFFILSLSFLPSWCRTIRLTHVLSGWRFHQPQWNWRKVHLRLEVSRRELRAEAHWTW